MQQQIDRSWSLRRRVLPQHTDHAGVMWHGAYLGWLEEARVEALAAVGLSYADIAARGLALPVVSLQVTYRKELLHGDMVVLSSLVLPRQGVRLPWRSRFINGAGELAAEAQVELVAVDRGGAVTGKSRPLRRLPIEMERAIASLVAGPQGLQGSEAPSPHAPLERGGERQGRQ